MGHDVAQANARAQLAALRAGTTTAGALINATTQQIADIAPLRAIAAFDPGRAQHLAARADATPADGPLHGLPVVVKDSIDTADLPTTAGTGALQGRTPTHDAPVVARLRAAGAIVAAKTTLHELSFGITGNNAVTGAVANPYDPNLIAGGSSSGSAVAVATGVASVALAADTGGSARLPAALCGVVGFRPTHGRYPGAGVVPISHTRDSVGVMARDVDGVALVDAVLAGEDPAPLPAVALAGARFGLPTQCWDDLDPGVRAVCDAACERLRDAGATFVDVDFGEVLARNADAGFPIAFHEFPRDLAAYLAAAGYDLTVDDVRRGVGSPDVAGVWDHLAGAGAVDEEAYRDALRAREQLRAAYGSVLATARLAAIAFPTAPLPARPIGHDETVELNGRQVPTFGTYIRNTDVAGNAGHPGISVPAGLTPAGLPVGLELDAAVGADRALLGLAAAVTAVLPPPARPADLSPAAPGG